MTDIRPLHSPFTLARMTVKNQIATASVVSLLAEIGSSDANERHKIAYESQKEAELLGIGEDFVDFCTLVADRNRTELPDLTGKPNVVHYETRLRPTSYEIMPTKEQAESIANLPCDECERPLLYPKMFVKIIPNGVRVEAKCLVCECTTSLFVSVCQIYTGFDTVIGNTNLLIRATDPEELV